MGVVLVSIRLSISQYSLIDGTTFLGVTGIIALNRTSSVLSFRADTLRVMERTGVWATDLSTSTLYYSPAITVVGYFQTNLLNSVCAPEPQHYRVRLWVSFVYRFLLRLRCWALVWNRTKPHNLPLVEHM